MRCLHKPSRKENLIELWEEFFESPSQSLREFGSSRVLAPVDIESDESTVYITTELPGVEKDKIEIDYENGVVFIKGEKETNIKRDEKNRHYQEISRGKVERRVQVGEVDFDKAEANYKNGHLELTIPRSESVKAKRLKIS